MRKPLISILAMFMLVVSLVFATVDWDEVDTDDTYPYPAGEGNDWMPGKGGFNADVLSSLQTRGLSDGQSHALVEDLDGDGTKEIIVLDGSGSLKLYHNPTLDIVDSIAIPAGNYAPPITSDIDGDGLIEVILSDNIQGDFAITIAEWDGTSFTSYIAHTGEWSGTTYNCDTLIQCNDGQGGTDDVECLQVLTCSPPGTFYSKTIITFGFNNESISSNVQGFSNDDADRKFCLPAVPALTWTNLDNAGRGEFLYSFGDMKTSGTDSLKVLSISVGENLVPSAFSPALVDTSFDPFDTTETCQDGIGRYFTSPMVVDLDGSSGTGKEIVIGVMLSDDTFVMRVFNSEGSQIDEHPELLFTSDGEILGNPMLANVFGDTGLVDYCIFGQDLSNSEGELLKLLCGSQQTGWTVFFISVNSIEFGYIKDGLFNISGDYLFPSTLGHMANMKQEAVDVTGGGLVATDTTEFVGTHGVFLMTDEDFAGWWTGNLMERIYDINTESACIVTDTQGYGASDIICVKETAVQYFDDNLINNPPYISSYLEDPCIDQGPVKLNNTMQIKLIGTDQNPEPLVDDLVTTRVTLYEGDSNEQVSTLPNQTSGVEVTHLFTFPPTGLNKTGSVRLLYEAWDEENGYGEADSILQIFTVGSAGVDFGDCESGQIIVAPEEVLVGEECSNDDQCGAGVSCIGGVCVADEDTLPHRAMEEASGLFGIGPTVLYLMIMLSLAIAVWFAPVSLKGMDFMDSMGARLGMIILLETFALIIGTIYGWLHVAILISIIILGLIAGSIWTVKKFSGVAQ